MYKYIYKLVNKISKFDQVVGNSSNEKGKIVERRIFDSANIFLSATSGIFFLNILTIFLTDIRFIYPILTLNALVRIFHHP